MHRCQVVPWLRRGLSLSGALSGSALHLSGPRRWAGRASAMLAKAYQMPTIRLKQAHLQPTEGSQGQLAIVHELEERVRLAPLFYKNAPIVLDAEEVREGLTTRAMEEIVEGLHDLHLIVVGFTGADTALQERANELGLPVLTIPKSQASLREQKKVEDVQSAEQETERIEVPGNVRSGQQVYAKGRHAQLVVMGNVSSGAEVLSDGDIVVFGTLSGRALAGVSGDSKARIFAAKLNAELVSIADVFCTGEQLPKDDKLARGASMVTAEGKKLKFEGQNYF